MPMRSRARVGAVSFDERTRRHRLASVRAGNAISVMLVVFGGVIAAIVLSGCAVVPGNDVYGMRSSGETSVELPIKTPQGTVTRKIEIQPITAALIVDKERTLDNPPTPPGLPRGGSDYRIGPGDILSIIVWDHPELTIPAGEFRSAEQAGTVVAENGTIFFPFAGVVKVSGLTLPQARSVLTQRLSRSIENVQLEVRVAAFRSQRVFVVGEVKTPGIYRITDVPMDVVEAVNQAGGFTEESDRRNITLTRNGKTHQIDLLALYENGDIAQNISMKHKDILNIPDRELNKVFVLGSVNRPGSQIMNKHRLTLAEAIGDAADIKQVEANPHQIYVLRGGDDLPEVYHLASKSPDALLLADRFPLQPRDVVYVDAASIIRWNRLISALLPTTTTLQNANDLGF